MRWRDFMANSLPRSWTKARRRNSIPKILKNNSKNNEHNENTENNNDIRTVDNTKFHFESIENMRYERKCMCVKDIPIVVPRSSIIPRRNRNPSSYNSLPKTNPYTQNSPEFKKASDEERNEKNDNETLPRTRSRIKTNPWLPSPKIPQASLTINFAASNSSLLSSMNGSRSSSMDRSLGSMGSRSSSIYSRSRSLCSPREFGSMELVKFDDDCGSGSGKLSSGIGLASDGEGTSISSMESEGFVFYESMDDLRSSPLMKQRNRMSFNYEDQFESMVESFHEQAQDSLTSLDMLKHDRSAQILVPPPRRTKARLHLDENLLPDEVDDGIGHSDDENTHLYVNLNYSKNLSKSETKPKPKVNRKPEIRLSLDSTSSNDSEMLGIEERAHCLELNESRIQLTAKPVKRSIEEVRAQLEAKVQQLRQDKYLVEEKIRAAKVEEKFREQMRHQKESTMRRKELMVRTLTDIRSRLEDQCQRLESTCQTATHKLHRQNSRN